MKRKKYILVKVNEEGFFRDGMIDTGDWDYPTRRDLLSALKRTKKCLKKLS